VYVALVGAVAQAAEWVNVGGTHKFDRYVDMGSAEDISLSTWCF